MSWFAKKPTMEDTMFELRMTSKQLSRQAEKSMKDADKEKLKVKKAMENRNVEAAQIYAQNVIRKRAESNNYLKLGSRLDGVSSRIKSAQMMNGISKQMGSVVKGLSGAINTMDLEKCTEIMDKFETQVEQLDTQDKMMNDALGSTSAVSVNTDAVDALMMEMGGELQTEAPDLVSVPSENVKVKGADAEPEDDELAEMARRMAALRETA